LIGLVPAHVACTFDGAVVPACIETGAEHAGDEGRSGSVEITLADGRAVASGSVRTEVEPPAADVWAGSLGRAWAGRQNAPSRPSPGVERLGPVGFPDGRVQVGTGGSGQGRVERARPALAHTPAGVRHPQKSHRTLAGAPTRTLA
jgi:hypothetical protein